MLHTKFQDRRLIRSGEDFYFFFYHIMGKVSILVMWPWPLEGTFVPPGTMDAYLSYKLANEPSAKLS